MTRFCHELWREYPSVWFDFDEWNADWRANAEQMNRWSLGVPEDERKLLVIAYSWGAGFGFINHALACRDRGIEIDHAVLADPIWHFNGKYLRKLCCSEIAIGRFLHKVGIAQVAAYYPWCECGKNWERRPQILVPENVKRVDYFVQRNDRWLRGHDLIAQDARTVIQRHDIRYRNHSAMDECPEFQHCAIQSAKELFG